MPFEGIDDTVSARLVGGARAARPGRRALQRREDLAGRRHGRRSTPRAASRRPRPMPSIASGSSSDGAGIDPNHPRAHRARRHRRAADYIDMAQTRAAAGAGDGCAHGRRSMRWCCRRRRSSRRRSPRLRTSDEFGRKNALLLRNTNPVNFFDLCAISLPLPRQDGLSSRADAGRPQRPGPAPVRHCRGRRKAASKADQRS